MTNLRAPLTFSDATVRVAGVLTYAAMARMVRKTERAVRYWSEEARGTTPTLAQALAFDAAYREAGGEGAPYRDAYDFQLGQAIARADACRLALSGEIADAARECGEAIAATILVTTSNASPRDTIRAAAEAEGAVVAMGRLVRRLASFLPAGVGPAARSSGGIQG